MDLALKPEDIAQLTEVQRLAVLDSLYTALIADGVPAPEKVARFDEAIAKLPWGITVGELTARISGIATRLATADQIGKRTFVDEVAAQIPEALRLNVIRSMAAIVAADHTWTYGERSSIATFIEAFGLSRAQIDELRAEVRQG